MPDPRVPSNEIIPATAAVELCLLLGRILFNFGATTQRIHDSIGALARHLGCRIELLVSYDALLLTALEGTTFRTRVDAARGVAGVNLQGLASISRLLRNLPGYAPDPEALAQSLRTIRDAQPMHRVEVRALAAGCAGAGFCVVNGGDPWGWLCGALAAALIFVLRHALTARNFNLHLTLFAVALAGSFLGGLLARLTHSATPAIALVAPILFLVPGVPLINGGIDVVRNHVAIGTARIGFTLAVLIVLFLATCLSVPLLPDRGSPPFAPPGAWDVGLAALAGALAAGALACLNNGALPVMALCALGGGLGRLVRSLSSEMGLDLITASLIGVLCSTVVVGFMAERLRWPAVMVTVMAALPMVPGAFAIKGLYSLLSFAMAADSDPAQLATSIQALAQASFISIALVVGIISPVVLLQRDRARV